MSETALSLSVRLDGKELSDQARDILKDITAEASKNTLKLKVGADDASIKQFIDKIKSLSPEVLAKLNIEIDGGSLQKQLALMKTAASKSISEIKNDFSKAILEGFKPLDIKSLIIERNIGKNYSKGNVEKLIGQLREEINKPITSDTAYMDIIKQVEALEQLNAVLAELKKNHSADFKLLDGKNIQGEIQGIGESLYNDITSMLSNPQNTKKYTAEILGLFESTKAKIINGVSDIVGGIGAAVDSIGEAVSATSGVVATSVEELSKEIEKAKEKLEDLKAGVSPREMGNEDFIRIIGNELEELQRLENSKFKNTTAIDEQKNKVFGLVDAYEEAGNNIYTLSDSMRDALEKLGYWEQDYEGKKIKKIIDTKAVNQQLAVIEELEARLETLKEKQSRPSDAVGGTDEITEGIEQTGIVAQATGEQIEGAMAQTEKAVEKTTSAIEEMIQAWINFNRVQTKPGVPENAMIANDFSGNMIEIKNDKVGGVSVNKILEAISSNPGFANSVYHTHPEETLAAFSFDDIEAMIRQKIEGIIHQYVISLNDIAMFDVSPFTDEQLQKIADAIRTTAFDEENYLDTAKAFESVKANLSDYIKNAISYLIDGYKLDASSINMESSTVNIQSMMEELLPQSLEDYYDILYDYFSKVLVDKNISIDESKLDQIINMSVSEIQQGFIEKIFLQAIRDYAPNVDVEKVYKRMSLADYFGTPSGKTHQIAGEVTSGDYGTSESSEKIAEASERQAQSAERAAEAQRGVSESLERSADAAEHAAEASEKSADAFGHAADERERLARVDEQGDVATTIEAQTASEERQVQTAEQVAEAEEKRKKATEEANTATSSGTTGAEAGTSATIEDLTRLELLVTNIATDIEKMSFALGSIDDGDSLITIIQQFSYLSETMNLVTTGISRIGDTMSSMVRIADSLDRAFSRLSEAVNRISGYSFGSYVEMDVSEVVIAINRLKDVLNDGLFSKIDDDNQLPYLETLISKFNELNELLKTFKELAQKTDIKINKDDLNFDKAQAKYDELVSKLEKAKSFREVDSISTQIEEATKAFDVFVQAGIKTQDEIDAITKSYTEMKTVVNERLTAEAFSKNEQINAKNQADFNKAVNAYKDALDKMKGAKDEKQFDGFVKGLDAAIDKLKEFAKQGIKTQEEIDQITKGAGLEQIRTKQRLANEAAQREAQKQQEEAAKKARANAKAQEEKDIKDYKAAMDKYYKIKNRTETGKETLTPELGKELNAAKDIMDAFKLMYQTRANKSKEVQAALDKEIQKQKDLENAIQQTNIKLNEREAQKKETSVRTQMKALNTQLFNAENAQGKTSDFYKRIADARAEYKALQDEIDKMDWNGLSEEQLKDLNERIETIKVNIKQLNGKGFVLAPDDKVESLKSRMTMWMSQNTSAKEWFPQINQMIQSLNGELSQEALEQISAGFHKIGQEAASAGKMGKSFTDTLMGSFRNLARYMLSFASFYRIIGVFKQAVNIIHELDDALVEVQKVSSASADTLQKWQLSTFDQASKVGGDALQIEKSTASWLRLGKSFKGAQEAAQASVKLLNTTEFTNIDDATSSLLSITQAYKELTYEDVIDKLNNVGDHFSSSSSDLAKGLQNAAAVLRTQGNDVDKALALLTAGKSLPELCENINYRMYLTALIA